jgi:hypothetical protein
VTPKRLNKIFPEIQVYVVYLAISVVSKTGFGIFLAHLACLKSEKSEMPENFQVHVSRITLIPSSKFKYIILEANLSNYLKL